MPLSLFKQKTALLSFKNAAGARRFSVVILCFLLFFFSFSRNFTLPSLFYITILFAARRFEISAARWTPPSSSLAEN